MTEANVAAAKSEGRRPFPRTGSPTSSPSSAIGAATPAPTWPAPPASNTPPTCA